MLAMMGNRRVATLIGSIGIALWATETTLIKFTERLPPLETVGLAFAMAAALGILISSALGGNPLAAFRQPRSAWLVTVVALVGYHACIYYAVQNAPALPAALLQGATPLMIVLGSAFLPGERLRWWHVMGTVVGLAGVVSLVSGEEPVSAVAANPAFYLALVGIAAALWGVYSLATRTFTDVPTSAMGMFFAAAALVAALGHLMIEDWVTPSHAEWVAIFGLGAFPMGLALYFWDHGVKRGDIQALGAISYFEPFLGALFVILVGQGTFHFSILWAGVLVIGGAALASRSVWEWTGTEETPAPAPIPGLLPQLDLETPYTVDVLRRISMVVKP